PPPATKRRPAETGFPGSCGQGRTSPWQAQKGRGSPSISVLMYSAASLSPPVSFTYTPKSPCTAVHSRRIRPLPRAGINQEPLNQRLPLLSCYSALSPISFVYLS